ncbi:cytochrome P450 [Streptomyces sp. SID5785]|uniref:cytochrome P450 n=1 Tax=Streptomyces sp. SID5785 TaxID=2690309 RepID=UPI00136159EC|nr:cytochrome P450 [Streptomyces sp. SID5785]MZD07202.1 cytochrome P450 [Streptomyces sp. SID5785]
MSDDIPDSVPGDQPGGDLRFPFEHSTLFGPPPEWRELREGCPVARAELPTGDHAWLVTRYEDVRAVLNDDRLSRAAATRPGTPRLGPARPEPDSVMAMDPPDHTRLRRLLAPAFTGRRTEALRPRIARTTERLLDTVAELGPPVDLVEHLARPLPIITICELLGVPEQDRESFKEWTDAALTLAPHAAGAVTGARQQLADYLRHLIAEKQQTPGDDLLGSLIAARDEDRLRPAELVTVAATLITAGYHTVANSLSNAVLALLRHPEQLEALRGAPEFPAEAVEELLRWTPGPVSGGTIRIATEEVKIGSTLVRPGEAVIPSTASANRDPRAFPDPDTLDLSRAANRHIAFGHGIHRCLGAPLARIELQVAFSALLRRFPGLRLAVDASELTWGSGMIRGLTELPVAW